MAFQEEIEKRRKKFTHPADQDDLNALEERHHRLITEKDYANHPMTLEIIVKAKDELRSINEILLNSDTPELVRQKLFGKRDAYTWFLEMFAKDFESEIKSIEDEVLTLNQ